MAANKEISIRDVADLAGVSPTTVSRVINNSDHPVNSKTKENVKKAVKELNFRPNRLAQGLKKNKSNLIGVIVHDIADAYFSQMVKGIEEVIFEYDYIINIFNTNREIEKELRSVEMLKANRADAVIFTGGNLLDKYYQKEMKRNVKELQRQNCHLVSVTSHPFAIKNIKIGNHLATKMMTEHLINKGHKRIAYINGPEILSTTHERLKGFSKTMENNNIKGYEKLIIPGDFTFKGGRKAAVILLDKLQDISAVMAANDESALGLMWEFKERGIKIPEDVSVTGIGNIPGSKYSYPPLTTVSIPLHDLGVQLGKYILSQLQEDIIKTKIDIQLDLIARKTVKNRNYK